jgi:predicted MFS family arabinose efflux permease
VLAILLAAPFLAQADATIANVATPAIRAGLGASGMAAELVIGGYLIAYAVLLITGARLGQTHGYKHIFTLGLAIFGVASLAAGLAPTPAVLVIARVVQGGGAALMYPQTLTGIQHNFTGDRRAKAIGAFAIALASGAVIGQLLGGILVSADIAGTSWRPIFLVNVPICVAVLAAALRLLPADPARRRSQLDLGGVGLLSVSLLLIVIPLVLGRTTGWPAWTWIALAAAIPVFAGFLTVQRRTANTGGHPLINTTILARPPVLYGLLALLLATGSYFALLFTLAQYLQTGLGRSALASGLILVPWVALFGVAGQITRRLPARVRPILPAAGYLLMTAAYTTLGLTLNGGTPGYPLLAVLLGAGGLGLGTGFATLLGRLTNAVPADYAPDISGVTTTTLQIGGAIAVAAFGTLYLALAGHGGPALADHAFAITSLGLASAALLAAAAGWMSTHHRDRKNSSPCIS